MHKKIRAAAAIVFAVLCALPLTACAKNAKKSDETPVIRPQTQSDVQTDEEIKKPEISIKIEGGFNPITTKPPLPGVIRKNTERNGIYSVEYIHTPYGTEKDETLDYRLELNADNTFELSVVCKGVSSKHNGHWYERRGEIMMFYDEEHDPAAHNEYYSDMLFGEILPFGKILIFENGATVVLAKENTGAKRFFGKFK